MTLGTVPLKGPRRRVFLMSEVPLYIERHAHYEQGSDLGRWAHNLFFEIVICSTACIRMWVPEASKHMMFFGLKTLRFPAQI